MGMLWFKMYMQNLLTVSLSLFQPMVHPCTREFTLQQLHFWLLSQLQQFREFPQT